MEHTCVGIKTMEIFKKGVLIRVNEKNEGRTALFEGLGCSWYRLQRSSCTEGVLYSRYYRSQRTPYIASQDSKIYINLWIASLKPLVFMVYYPPRDYALSRAHIAWFYHRDWGVLVSYHFQIFHCLSGCAIQARVIHLFGCWIGNIVLNDNSTNCCSTRGNRK